MKVVMISRATLFTAPGGDSIQLTETASHLRKLGISVDIKLSNEIIEYHQYDLLHFFNIIRPADILFHTTNNNIPYVISTIFVDYSEFETRVRKGFTSLLSKTLGPDFIEYLKIVGRAVLNGERINSLSYLWFGHTKSIKKVLRRAALLLPNSESEYNRLFVRYKVKAPFKVIPNAINTEIFHPAVASDPVKAGVCCVARIEPLKNQLNLIRAVRGTNRTLYIVGRPSPNNLKYFQQCKDEADQNVVFIDHVSQSQLVEVYKKCKVHALPSWFETTGLSSLEAAVSGCNIVITSKGDTREYYKSYAYYSDPGDTTSIRAAIDEAYSQPTNYQLIDYILKNFTWDRTASLTLEAYKQATGNE